MKGIIASGACAATIALAPVSAWAEETRNEPAQSQASMQHQLQQIEALTEIEELAIVRLRRPAAQEEAESDEAVEMPTDDLLLGGFGERRMMTAEDEDDPFEAAIAEETAQTPTHGPDARADAAQEPENGPLLEAIEANAALSQALEERGVNIAQVVTVEVRNGSSVIVYLDETRS